METQKLPVTLTAENAKKERKRKKLMIYTMVFSAFLLLITGTIWGSSSLLGGNSELSHKLYGDLGGDSSGLNYLSYQIFSGAMGEQIDSYKSNPKVNDLQVSLDNGLKISYLNYDITYLPVFILQDDTQLAWADIPGNIEKDLWKVQVASNKYKYGVDFTGLTTAQKNALKFVALKRVNATKTVTICDEYLLGMCIESHVEVQPMTSEDVQGKIKIVGKDLIIGNKVLLSNDDLLRTYNLPTVNRSVIVIGGLDNSWEVCDEYGESIEGECISSHTEYNWIDNGDGTWNITFDPTITIDEDDVVTTSLLTNITAETGAANFTHLTVTDDAPYDSLVGYWNFDGDLNDTTTTTHYDWSSSENDGTGVNQTVVNSTGCIEDYGNCAHFDGDGDEINTGAKVISTGDFTVGFWFNQREVNQLSAVGQYGVSQGGRAIFGSYTNGLYYRIGSDSNNAGGGKFNKYLVSCCFYKRRN